VPTTLGKKEEKKKEMLALMQKFWREESGQDLIEYTLLLCFIALATASLFLGTGSSLAGMWTKSSNEMAIANATS